MDQEKQIAQALIEGDLSWPEWMNGVAAAKKVRGLDIPANQLLESIEAATELRDPEFRAAAIDMLDLRKRTGKSLEESEVYIKELGTRVATLEKNITAEEELESRLKQNIKQCRQQREEEEDKLKKEKAKNSRILAEDRKKLEQQLAQNNQTRENVAQTVTLASKLRGIGLDLPCFISVVEEINQHKEIDLPLGKEICNHIAEYGSFLKAKERVKGELRAIKANVAELSQEESRERKVIATLNEKANKLMEDIKAYRNTIESQEAYVERKRFQYSFFETFVNMLLKSPSVPGSAQELGFATSRAAPLVALGTMIRALNERGWGQSAEETPEKRRAAFIVTVMGAYLRSAHCGRCGASFIVNKAHNAYNQYKRSYDCPVCDLSNYTKPDDTFFNLMVSPELAKRFQDAQSCIDTMEKTDFAAIEKKVKALDLLPDEVCRVILGGGKVEIHGAD